MRVQENHDLAHHPLLHPRLLDHPPPLGADAAGFDALVAFSSSWRPGNAFWLTGVTPTNGHVLAVAGPVGIVLQLVLL